MPDLLADTRVTPTGAPGRYAASLSPDWAVWGPNGGYLAALALQAAFAESRFERPASFHCHFLAVGSFDAIELEVTTLGGGRRAESLRVDLRQGGRLLLAATVWMSDDGLNGYEHEVTQAPAIPGPASLRSFEKLAGDEYENWFPIWRSVEGRPLHWGHEVAGDPEWHCWLRLSDTRVRSLQEDALRQVFWLDMPGWNAMIAAHTWPFRFIAPSLDLMVQFHRFAPEEEWQGVHGVAPLAADGLAGCVARLWTPDGRLLSTGASSHTCRPNPSYAEELERARAMGVAPREDD